MVVLGAFTLKDDRLDRRFGVLEVAHFREAAHGKLIGAHLHSGIADEEVALAERFAEVNKPAANAAIEMPDGGVVLRRWHEASVAEPAPIRERRKPSTIGHL